MTDDNTPFPEPVVIEITGVFDLHTIPPREIKLARTPFVTHWTGAPPKPVASAHRCISSATPRQKISRRVGSAVAGLTNPIRRRAQVEGEATTKCGRQCRPENLHLRHSSSSRPFV